jgi:hypothetical protein
MRATGRSLHAQCLKWRDVLAEGLGGAAEERGRACIASAPGRRMLALSLTTYQQHGSMPAQQAAPATQQLAAKAVAENAEAPIAATALRYTDFMKLLQLIDLGGRQKWTLRRQSGGFHGGGVAESLCETSKPLTASGLVASSAWPCPLTIAGAMEQPMQPCPDWESTQHGCKPAQHAVKGAATAPATIQANMAMATKRESDSCIQRMPISLLDRPALRRDGVDCAA